MKRIFNFKQVFRILGYLVASESIFMLIAAIVGLFYGETDTRAMLEAAGITAAAGILAAAIGYRADKAIGMREGYVIVGVVWIVFSFFGMLPFLLSGSIPKIEDAFFETMSGFTTTGASILNDIESLSHVMLFWRSLIQWLGGMGIVVLSLAVLPFLGGGLQIFAAEVPGPTYDKLQPRIKDTARRLWGLYGILTLVETIMLAIGGMSIFDAVCHSFTTMATGGYSTKQASIAYWDSPFIQYTIILFMFFAGTNFTLLYFSMVKGKVSRLFKDEEFQAYVTFIGISTLLITIGLMVYNNVGSWIGFEQTFRDSLFQTVSIITTTGFATADYMVWRPILWAILLLLMFTGASAGSTSGGVKMVRILTLIKNGYFEFKRLVHPKAVLPVRINRHVVPEKIVGNIYAFVTFYVTIIIASTFILLVDGMPLGESIGAVLTSISNVGPGIGSLGPAGNFAMVSPFAKWFLSFLMLIGRLELFTILVILSPAFWKK